MGTKPVTSFSSLKPVQQWSCHLRCEPELAVEPNVSPLSDYPFMLGHGRNREVADRGNACVSTGDVFKQTGEERMVTLSIQFTCDLRSKVKDRGTLLCMEMNLAMRLTPILIAMFLIVG